MFQYSLYVVCCLYVTFLLPPERATKAGPCHLFTTCLFERYKGELDVIIRSDIGKQRHAVTSVGAHIDVDSSWTVQDT